MALDTTPWRFGGGEVESAAEMVGRPRFGDGEVDGGAAREVGAALGGEAAREEGGAGWWGGGEVRRCWEEGERRRRWEEFGREGGELGKGNNSRLTRFFSSCAPKVMASIPGI